MLSAIYTDERLFLRIGLAVLAFAVLGYVYTGFLPLLVAPMLWVYVVLMLKNWKMAFWLFLFFIPLSVRFSFSGNSLSLCGPDEPMMWSFLLLGLLLYAYEPSALKGWWYLNPLVLVVICQFIWLICSVVYSTVPLLSFKFLLSKIWLLAACFVMPIWIFREKEDFKMAFLILLTSVLFTILGIFFSHSTTNFLFSDIHRAAGLFYENHVEYSSVISMFFPFIFIACLWLRDRDKRKARWMFVIACFFILAIFLSYARAAVLAVLFSFFVYYAIKKRFVHWIMPAIYGIIALMLFYVVRNEKYLELRPNYEQTYMNWDFSEHMKATFKGRDESSMERLYRWIAAIRMSKMKPVFGYGPHGFYYNYKIYTLRSFKTYASKNVEHSTTHNYFLYMLTEQGYPAMGLYALLNIVIFSQAQRIYHRFKDRFYKLCTMGIAMLFAASFVNNFFSELVDTHKVGALFFISLSLLVILGRKSREEQNAVV